MMARSNNAKVTVVLTRKQLELLERMAFLTCCNADRLMEDGYKLESIVRAHQRLEDALAEFDETHE